MHARELTDDEFEIYFKQAQELSQFFREIGPKYDVENTFAYPTIQPFRESGLPGLGVPKRFGGAGGSILQVSKVITELSRGDSAIALAYNMHYIMTGISL